MPERFVLVGYVHIPEEVERYPVQQFREAIEAVAGWQEKASMVGIMWEYFKQVGQLSVWRNGVHQVNQPFQFRFAAIFRSVPCNTLITFFAFHPLRNFFYNVLVLKNNKRI
jgi:hypothetical protein